MPATRGVIYVAVGDPAYRRMARESIGSLRSSGYRGPIAVVVEKAEHVRALGDGLQPIVARTSMARDTFASRGVKTTLHRLTPFDQTLYLDCDTLIIWNPDDIWRHLRTADYALALDRHATVG